MGRFGVRRADEGGQWDADGFRRAAEEAAGTGCPYYWADIILSLQDINPLDRVRQHVQLKPVQCPDALFDHAVTLTRTSTVTTYYAEDPARKVVWDEVRHVVFYDATLPEVAAARLIAHDLFHIAAHQPESPRWQPWIVSDGRIDYSCGRRQDGEKDADRFSLALLAHHAFRPGWRPPETPRRLIEQLDAARRPGQKRSRSAAWPFYMKVREAEDFIRALYA